MISDRRPRWRGPEWVVCLVLALVTAISAAPVSAAPAARGNGAHAAQANAAVPTRIEGFLRLVDGEWFLENTRVLIGPNTAINERRGKMQAGAWVAVWGDMTEQTLTATILHVLRPAGARPPTLEFAGVLTKMSNDPQLAMVSGTQVFYDSATVIPVAPPRYSLVRITGFRQGEGVLAEAIDILAMDANSVPVYIEGVIEQVTDARVVVDGKTVALQAQDIGRVNQGDWVQVRGLVAQDGTIVADVIKVVDRSLDAKLDAFVLGIKGYGEENQTWDVVTFEGGRPQSRRVFVTNDTYIDEDRASMGTDIEATIEGSKVSIVDVKAQMIRLDQPAPAEQVGTLTQAGADDLWSINGQPVYLPPDTAGSEVRATLAASGQNEVVVSGARLSNGVLVVRRLRAASAAELAAARAQRASTASTGWVGPMNVVSRVDGQTTPALLFGPDRTAHLVYESEGYIWYISRADGKAWNAPRRLVKGTSPTAALDAFGNLHIAYVNNFLDNTDIFHLMMKRSGEWNLPGLVSGTTGASADPALAADDKGRLHIAWMDHTSGAWAVHSGEYDGTFWVNYPVPNASGGSPSITVLSNGNLFLAWHARVPTARDSFGALNVFGAEQTGGTWDLPVNISDNASFSPGAESRDPSIVAASDGYAHLAWVDDNQQPRYDFGRGLYWPAPVNLGPRQSYANGLTLRLGVDNMLYATWDDRTTPLFASAPIGAQTWAPAQPLPGATGLTYGASLALAGRGMAVVWLQDGTAANSRAIYESRSGLANPLLKNWLPVITH